MSINVMALKLPTSSAGCGSILIRANSCKLVVKYEYNEDGKKCIGCISFGYVCLYRFTGEMFGYVSGSYDALCVIEESEWLSEARQNAASEWITDAKHYALYFSNNGYLEVIARSFVQGPVTEGLLETDFEEQSALDGTHATQTPQGGPQTPR